MRSRWPLWAFTLWISLPMGLGASSPVPLLSETLEIMTREYVNPLGLEPSSLTAQLRKSIDAQCASSCDSDQSERAIASSLNKIGDVHLKLLPAVIRPGDDPGGVGDGGHAARFGVRIVSSQNRLLVSSVQADSSAANAKLEFGDRIVRVNADESPDVMARVLARAEVERKTVTLTLLNQQGQRRTVSLAPTSRPWDASLELRDDGIAVLRLPSVSASNEDDSAVHRLVRQAMQSSARVLILDLRDTQGGTPFATANAAGAFLERVAVTLVSKAGVRLNYTFQKGDSRLERSDQPTKPETDRLEQPALWTGPLVVLVSKRTVSAGENLALLLQRAGRARVIGEATAGGAGVGANLFKLSSGANLLLATHLHLTADGQRYPIRVTPDQLEAMDVEALSRGRDNQLEAALTLLQPK